MNERKLYFKDLDLIRLLSCIGVLFYHFNLLKGGYLAVCVFFVLSGYLSCISAFKKEKFSFLDYYKNKFIKIYLPLLIIVFITIAVVSLFPNINWFNLKPETTSVLLGYNNFWQLSANLDYFARHVNSPFMHLWYIAILLQFDVVFPLIFIPLRKIGDKIHKILPCVITALLSVIFGFYFYKSSLGENIMVTYYNTFTRIFSIILGLCLGFVNSYYGKLIPSKLTNKPINRIILYAYILVICCLFIFIDAQSVYFPISMILSSIIACRLLDYGTIDTNTNLNIFNKIIKNISKVTYQIYLFQYPVIFMFQNVNINQYLKVAIVLIITIALSYIVHFCITFNKKHITPKSILGVIILIISVFGIYKYIIAVDHTEEMKALEEQLAKNKEIMEQKQAEYEQKLKEEQAAWNAMIENLENGEANLKDMVANLPIVCIGDSVMLGASGNLYAKFPNAYVNAEISRTAWVANDIINNLKYLNMLGDPIIFNLGANGDCTQAFKKQIINNCGNRKIFWINVTNDSDVYVNYDLTVLDSMYENLYVIDWASISKGHWEYFMGDGIHLTEIGRQVYTEAIYDAIYNVYLEEFTTKKEQILNAHDKQQKEKISFYGNDLLLNVFDYIQADFPEAKFSMDKKSNFETIKNEIETAKTLETLTHKIVFAFDISSKLSIEDYEELITLCTGHEIYILNATNKTLELTTENVTVINFYEELQNNSDFLMPDKIHLTAKGNEALAKVLNSSLIVTK